MVGHKLFHCHGGPWGGKSLYLRSPKTLMLRFVNWYGRYVPYGYLNDKCVRWENAVVNTQNFLEEVKRCVASTQQIGDVVDTVEQSSSALKTVMKRHRYGLSLEHYRRFFKHLNGVEIPGSSEWVLVRCQHWSMGAKLFDIINSEYDVVDPAEPIRGDVDD